MEVRYFRENTVLAVANCLNVTAFETLGPWVPSCSVPWPWSGPVFILSPCTGLPYHKPPLSTASVCLFWFCILYKPHFLIPLACYLFDEEHISVNIVPRNTTYAEDSDIILSCLVANATREGVPTWITPALFNSDCANGTCDSSDYDVVSSYDETLCQWTSNIRIRHFSAIQAGVYSCTAGTHAQNITLEVAGKLFHCCIVFMLTMHHRCRKQNLVCRGPYCATQSMVTNFLKHVSHVPQAMFSIIQFLIAYSSNKLTVRSHSENILSFHPSQQTAQLFVGSHSGQCLFALLSYNMSFHRQVLIAWNCTHVTACMWDCCIKETAELVTYNRLKILNLQTKKV